VLYFVGGTLIANLRQLPKGEVSLNFAVFAAGVFCYMVASLLTTLTTRFAVASFGVRLPTSKIAAAYWVAALGKYVPGKVVSVTGLVALLARLGVRLPVAISVPFLTLVISFVTGVVISAPFLLAGTSFGQSVQVWILLGVAVLVAAVFLHPRVLTAIVNLILRRMGRSPIADRLRTGPMLLTAACVALRGMALGLGMWCICRSLTNVELSAYPFIMASTVGANLLGLLAFFVPAGIGVREGIFMALLGPLLGPGIAAMATVLARIVATCVDLILGGTGVCMLKSAGVLGGKPDAS